MSDALRVTLSQDNEKEDFYIVNSSLTVQAAKQALIDKACGTLDSIDSAKSFLKYIGASISVETPDSSNVQRIVFNSATNEVSFVFDNDSESTYPSTFEKFLEDIKAPSAGKQQWKYRRGQR